MIYLVIDAVGERPQEKSERQMPCEVIKDLMTGSLSNLQILATSRRERDIAGVMLDVPTIYPVSFQNRLVDIDIQTYVDAQFVLSPKLNRWSDQLKGLIKDSLVNNAHGM